MKYDILKCPNCDQKLSFDTKVLSCTNGHVFDISKEGYFNLLLPNQKKTKLPGDNKEMILNREAFLSFGHYDYLVLAITSSIKANTNFESGLHVLDIGCGSGFFLRSLKHKSITKIGIDISKFAIKKAAKLDKDALFVVATFLKIPTLNNSIDIILNNFAPLNLPEVVRVLKTNGAIIKIVPYKNHMRQLAELIYKEFRAHSTDFIEDIKNNNDLEIINKTEITYERNINKEEAMSLISMTPYFHTFKLTEITIPDFITVTFSFLLIEARKIEKTTDLKNSSIQPYG